MDVSKFINVSESKNTGDVSVYSENRGLYVLSVIFLFLDYTRLHETFHLGVLRPLMLINIFLVILIFKSGKLFNTNKRQLKLIFIFIFLLALYIPFAANNYQAYIATRTMLLYTPVIIAILISLNTVERLKNFILFNVIFMSYVAIYSLGHSGHGPGNYLLDENDLALYVILWIPFCYFFFSIESVKFKKIIYSAALVLGLLAVVVSFSRGGFVGLVTQLFVIWLCSHRKIIGIMVVGVLIASLFLFSDPSYQKEMSTVTDTKESTATQRIESWKSAWNMFEDHPLGVGGNNFPVLFQEYQTDYFQRGMWGRVAHSLWFTLLPELGIAGVIIYVLLLSYNIGDAFFLKNIALVENSSDVIYLNNLGRALICALAGFFAAATFLSVLYYAHYWYLSGLIAAAVDIANNVKEPAPRI